MNTPESDENGTANIRQEEENNIDNMMSEEEVPNEITEVATQAEVPHEIGDYQSDEELMGYLQDKVPADNEEGPMSSQMDMVNGTQEQTALNKDGDKAERVGKAQYNDSIQQLSSIFEVAVDDILNKEPDDEAKNLITEAQTEADEKQEMYGRNYSEFDDAVNNY